MVRNKKTCTRVKKSDADIASAVEKVITKEMTIREAADNIGMNKSTLARAVSKKRVADKEGREVETFQPNHGHNLVFSTQQEAMLLEYILHASKLHQGMTKKSVQKFAHEYAKHLEIKYPSSWDTNEMAGA